MTIVLSDRWGGGDGKQTSGVYKVSSHPLTAVSMISHFISCTTCAMIETSEIQSSVG